ncbi:MAG: 50S ribosomal protein L40e [Candidatus Nanohaloarchaea archaeon]
MADRFDVAEKRLFDDVYVCRRCNAKNRTDNPEEESCRKCGYSHLRKKNVRPVTEG